MNTKTFRPLSVLPRLTSILLVQACAAPGRGCPPKAYEKRFSGVLKKSCHGLSNH